MRFRFAASMVNSLVYIFTLLSESTKFYLPALQSTLIHSDVVTRHGCNVLLVTYYANLLHLHDADARIKYGRGR